MWYASASIFVQLVHIAYSFVYGLDADDQEHHNEASSSTWKVKHPWVSLHNLLNNSVMTYSPVLWLGH